MTKTSTRKSWEPTPETRKMVEQLVAFGIPNEQIMNMVIGPSGKPMTSKQTLYRHFRSELENGEAKANAKVAQCLFAQATVGNNVTAQIFWLKTRARWRETNHLELTGKDGGPIESKAAPEAMTDEELQRIASKGRG